MMDIQYVPFGENGLKVVFRDEISQEIHERILQLYQSIKRHSLEPITEIVPSYTVLTIYFDERKARYEDVKQHLEEIWASTQHTSNKTIHKTIVLPTYYGGEVGEDLTKVAQKNRLTTEEVIERHASQDYLTYMIGFLPGFPYLGGMDERLATPRLEQPRKRVAAGSVGIAGGQTGVYPVASPGGWNIIGQTPVPIIDFEREEPFLVSMGDYVRFRPIQLEEYHQITQDVQNGHYTFEMEERGGITHDATRY